MIDRVNRNSNFPFESVVAVLILSRFHKAKPFDCDFESLNNKINP